MHQYQPINYKKCSMLMKGVNSGGTMIREEGSVWGPSLYYLLSFL